MARQKWNWNELNLRRADIITLVVDELTDYWPLTLRQIHYRLVERRPNWCKYSIKTDAPYENTVNHYQALSRLLKWMRIDKKLSWEVLTDRTRRVSEKRGLEDLDEFIDDQLYWFLRGYERCLVQSQDVYVELWVEKDALSSVFEDVADPFCLRVVTRRGYNSVTYEADYFNRATMAIERGQKPVVLYFGDFDPSGNDMLRASLETLQAEMGLDDLKTIRVALTEQQIEQYSLPPKPGAAKKKDPRYKEYVKKYGTSAWELDALHPRDLEQIASDALHEVLDMDSFEAEQQQERLDKNRIRDIRTKVMASINRELESLY